MKVCGFTIIRNAIKYDYPIVEAINSILPICDKFIVAVGKSEDNTRKLITSINSPKIEIIDTVWDDTLREGGKVLAVETNKAFDAIDKQYDWAFYIQSDEVVHEKYLPNIKTAMEKWVNRKEIDGLLFHYKHFYGSYDYIATSRKWYRKEIRIIRNDKAIRSYKDAQGFRKSDNTKLAVKQIDAYIYHYGWVKHPRYQQAKQEDFNKLWHDDQWVEKNIEKVDAFNYDGIDMLEKFHDNHPKVMQERVEKMNWEYAFDPTKAKVKFKLHLLNFIEKHFGWRPGEYKNYRLK